LYLKNSLFFLLFALLINGCSAVKKSQFIKPSLDLISHPLEIENPENKILLIYNHGSTSEENADPCFPNSTFLAGGMPSIIRSLVGKKIAGKDVVVYAFCSRIKGLQKSEDTPYNLKIRYRINEIISIVKRFTDLGIVANNIFLVGHSAGGWASLMIEASNPKSINAVIAFSPAFSGVKSRRNQQWQQFRDDQEKELKSAKKINALIYAFRRDAYNSLADLSFFSQISGVEYYPLSGDGSLLSCYRGHRAVFKSCFEATQSATIIDFISRRLKQVSNTHN
jgi:hypothetical protein